ncbi:hypothetical protein GCM10007877_13650 [Marinibactrum halimedae]|uniref:Uncharacterized protein n=1 Tax=Marinibactrum halimedae TaxID=1444977 RepID=A0AA37T525_9GAMM|nr:hypothetical protein GCM10007877_13650 [Marinibactrum halimedae]
MSLKEWIFNILVAIDKLCNTLCRGSHEVTVSARIGHFANLDGFRYRAYWKLLEWIIDFSFYPVEGPGHCIQARDTNTHKKYELGNDIMRGVFAIAVIIVCTLISIVTWTLYALRLVRPD